MSNNTNNRPVIAAKATPATPVTKATPATPVTKATPATPDIDMTALAAIIAQSVTQSVMAEVDKRFESMAATVTVEEATEEAGPAKPGRKPSQKSIEYLAGRQEAAAVLVEQLVRDGAPYKVFDALYGSNISKPLSKRFAGVRHAETPKAISTFMSIIEHGDDDAILINASAINGKTKTMLIRAGIAPYQWMGSNYNDPIDGFIIMAWRATYGTQKLVVASIGTAEYPSAGILLVAKG